MPSYSITIPSLPENHPILVALLEDSRVEGFLELESSLVAYVSTDDFARMSEDVIRLASNFLTAPIVSELIPDRNWNEEWKNSIQPIEVGPFRVLPSWCEQAPTKGLIDTLIDPKMSFGTGYHESTRLLLRHMDRFVGENDYVLDAGTGTGILSFAALGLGAASAEAFDIDPICRENALENAEQNKLLSRFEVQVGDESVVEGHNFNVILANINQEALRAMIPGLIKLLAPDGTLGLAGLLVSDREVMLAEIEAWGLKPVHEAREAEWWSVWVARNG